MKKLRVLVIGKPWRVSCVDRKTTVSSVRLGCQFLVGCCRCFVSIRQLKFLFKISAKCIQHHQVWQCV